MAQQDKEQQKKLITEIMNDDAKDGLYDHIVDTNKMLTAVEWLIKRLVIEEDGKYHVELPYGNIDVTPIIEQAKQMEKEQIQEAWNDGNFLGRNGNILADYSDGKGYYKSEFENK